MFYANTKTRNVRANRGFTLVEMIVSLGIFSIVSVVALGAMVRIITANQKAQSLQAAMTNINFALEAMSRDLRVGTEYHCWNDGNSQPLTPGNENSIPYFGCLMNNNAVSNPSNTSVITFKSSRASSLGTCNLLNSYRFINVPNPDGNVDIHVQKMEQNSCGETMQVSNYLDLISAPNVRITDYRLGVTSGVHYPYVTIRLIGYAGKGERDRTDFDIQTTVSGRVPQQ